MYANTDATRWECTRLLNLPRPATYALGPQALAAAIGSTWLDASQDGHNMDNLGSYVTGYFTL